MNNKAKKAMLMLSLAMATNGQDWGDEPIKEMPSKTPFRKLKKGQYLFKISDGIVEKVETDTYSMEQIGNGFCLARSLNIAKKKLKK